MTQIPEPPDGTRIEFEHHTDVYAAWRDDDSSAQAGYPVGDGGEVWCLHGHTVPCTWSDMLRDFGDSLLTMVRLVPVPEDVPNYKKWPTAAQRDVTSAPYRSDPAGIGWDGTGDHMPGGEA